MKKLIKIMAVAMIIFVATACTSTSTEYTGEWKTVDFVSQGQSYRELAQSAGLDTSSIPGIDLILNEDGSAKVIDTTGTSQEVEGTWKTVDTGIEVVVDGTAQLFTTNEHQLIIDINGTQIILEKK